MILKSDGEPASIALKRLAARMVREEYRIEIVPEESEAYISQTSGTAEQAVYMVQGNIRTLRFAAEKLHGVELEDSHVLLTWAAEFAGQIMSRAHRYTSDGRTAFERIKGRRCRSPMPRARQGLRGLPS